MVISTTPPDLPGPFTFIPWNYHNFPNSILEGELCVAPRNLHNIYNQGHSNFKIGVFMAQGVPALGAPLDSYRELIERTGAGLICNGAEEWEEALDRLLADRELLKRWSAAAYEGMEPYTTEKVAQRYYDLFTELAQS